MKRGGIHVDWIMSMGLFVISTFLLLIFFKPDVQPTLDTAVVLDNLVEKFNEDFTWEIRKSPVFIDTCTNNGNDGGGSEQASLIEFDLDARWVFTNAFFSSIGSMGSGSINIDNDNVQCFSAIYGGLGLGNGNIHASNTDKAKIELIYTPEEGAFAPNFNANCNPEEDINMNTVCKIKVGSEERIKGYSDNVNDFDNLIWTEDAETIKSRWGFPPKSEFWVLGGDITTCTINDVNGCEIDYRTANPYQQATVVSREVRGNILNNIGSLEPIVIFFRVWE